MLAAPGPGQKPVRCQGGGGSPGRGEGSVCAHAMLLGTHKWALRLATRGGAAVENSRRHGWRKHILFLFAPSVVGQLAWMARGARVPCALPGRAAGQGPGRMVTPLAWLAGASGPAFISQMTEPKPSWVTTRAPESGGAKAGRGPSGVRSDGNVLAPPGRNELWRFSCTRQTVVSAPSQPCRAWCPRPRTAQRAGRGHLLLGCA